MLICRGAVICPSLDVCSWKQAYRIVVDMAICMAQVLDAPQLQDDFYLNLVEWSSQNVLAVGLGTCVYLWSACTSKVGSLARIAGNFAAEDRHALLHPSPALARVDRTVKKLQISFIFLCKI